MTIRVLKITAAIATVLVASCGGGDPTEPDNTVATVTVTGASTIAPGATSQLTAIPRNAAGTTLTGLTATWSSSANGVATVNGSGLVSAVANGTATITATVGGQPGTRQITVATVTPVAAASVTVAGSAFSPQQVDITVGGTVTWNFSDIVSHNVTFSAAGSPGNISDQASGSAARTFTTVGTFPYQCTIHNGMTGTVVVH